MKVFIILLSTILIFSCMALPVFAVNGLTIDSYLSEPVPSDSVAYFAIAGSSSDARLYAFFVNPQEGHIQIEQYFEQGKYAFNVYVRKPDGSLRQDFSFWVGRYNLIDGTCYALNFYPASGSTNYHSYHNLVLSSDSTYTLKPYYWFSGNITCENVNGLVSDSSITPSLLHLSWNGTGQALLDIKGQISAVQLIMSSLYNRVDLTFQDVDMLLSVISSHYQWFENTYYNAILNKWDVSNAELAAIYQRLVSIENGLFANTGETTPDQSEMQSNVDDYVSQEHVYIEDFNNQVSFMGDAFDNASNNISTFTNAFGFINNIFNSFIPSSSYPYIIIFISMSFGLVVLILGRKKL